MMPGGGGNVERPWQICRKANTIKIARKGANVAPNTAAPINKIPQRSIKMELVNSAALAARGCVKKYWCQGAVRSWIMSPMPFWGADFRAINDCVQNQTTNAPATTPARRPMPGQCIPANDCVMVWFGRCGREFCFPQALLRAGAEVQLPAGPYRRCGHALDWLQSPCQ